MIKCNDYDELGNYSDKKCTADLVADTKDEVIAMGSTTKGVEFLADGYTLLLGSTCMTAQGDFGILGSDGNWNF